MREVARAALESTMSVEPVGVVARSQKLLVAAISPSAVSVEHLPNGGAIEHRLELVVATHERVCGHGRVCGHWPVRVHEPAVPREDSRRPAPIPPSMMNSAPVV
jgi:hypothetical protein